jgi:hypothetical protein
VLHQAVELARGFAGQAVRAAFNAVCVA